MGFVTAGCAVSVHRADGTEAAPDEVGEIVVGGAPRLTLFAGYLDDPDTTEASFRDGWFLTGDRARRDATGRFTFDGRRADVLKVAGENVSTVEVEQVLSAHPGVLEAAVVGQPDPVRDEVPVAFVVAADPANPPTRRRAARVVRRAADEVEAAPRHHVRRRAAAHQRRQDPQVPPPRSRRRASAASKPERKTYPHDRPDR